MHKDLGIFFSFVICCPLSERRFSGVFHSVRKILCFKIHFLCIFITAFFGHLVFSFSFNMNTNTIHEMWSLWEEEKAD